MTRLLADVTPLRVVPEFRRIWTAQVISTIGQQMSAVAVGLQVWDLTHSSFMVGLVGLCQLVPLVGFGLYAGALSDTHDRRIIGIIGSAGMWVASAALFAQSFLGIGSVALLYLIIALQSCFYAIGSAVRSAIIARVVPERLLAQANALSSINWSLGPALGPLLGGVIIGTSGLSTAYLIDVIAFAAMAWAMFRLPSLPPTPQVEGERRKTGWASVAEGLSFLKDKRNLMMTFYVDLAAMVLASPRALMPAIAAEWYGGTTKQVALTLGLLAGAPAIGALVSGVLSGPLGGIRFQGRVVIIAIIAWGACIGGFGLTKWLPLGLLLLALAGAADNVSAVFRTTILQVATPDEFRGRLQGVFVVVVSGGPKLGDVEAGTVATLIGEQAAIVVGGATCIAVVLALTRWRSTFWRYDAQHPVP